MCRFDETPAPPRTPAPPAARPERRNPNDTDVPAGPTQLAPPGHRRSVPALVTPSSKQSQSASQLRRAVAETPAAAQSHPPTPERTGPGTLFPALVIGTGRIGLSVLRALRHQISERFGAPSLPHLRWLFLDTDPAAGDEAVAGPSAVALAPEDVLLTRLRRPTHYLTREGLPAIDTWLPQEELFRMPKTPATEGVRGLGRLALCDHYHVVCLRVRAALEAFLTPAALEESDRATRLGLRSTFPRVYLATSLTGGTGSGMFIDLAYLVRRVARQMGFGAPHVVGLLGVPTYSAESSDAPGMANARAALTELHHYGCAGAGYKTQFDTREGPFVDPDRPFRRCVLVPIGTRFDPAGSSRGAELAAHAALTDMLTPIGRAAHPDDGSPGSLLTLVGVRRLAWPRTAVLRAAGWQLARKTLQFWADRGTGEPMPAVAAAVDALWAERPFDRAAVRPLLDKHVADALRAAPPAVVEQVLRPLTDGTQADKPEMVRARTVFARFLDLIGRPGNAEDDNPYQLDPVLGAKVKDVSAQVDSRLAATVLSLVEQPGLRLAGADQAVELIRERLRRELDLADAEAAAREEQAYALYVPLVQLLAPGTTPSGLPRSAADLAGLIRQWALARIEGLLARACANVFRALLGNVPESVRELTAIRAQLQAFPAKLDGDPPAVPSSSSALLQAVFPGNARNSSEAAGHILRDLRPEDLREFENALQARLRHEFRGIGAVCARPGERGPAFLTAVVDQACKFLDARTPRLNASEILARTAGNPKALWERVGDLVAHAAPVGVGPERTVTPALTVLGTPADDVAAPLAEAARALAPSSQFRTVTTLDDIILYQETPVSLAALPHLGSDSGPVAEADGRRPASNHSRIDVSWTPVGFQ
jgi:hypothetical protein